MAFVESGENAFAAWHHSTAASFSSSYQPEIPSRLPLSSVSPSRLSDSSLKLRTGFNHPLDILALSIASMLIMLVVASCSGDSEPTAVPTATRQPATVAPTPEPAEATATPGASGEAVGENGDEITSEDILATVFEDWGSTCLNNAYPPNAPQLDDVTADDLSTDPNGLEFATIQEGEGVKPKLDWEVDVQYTGWLEDGCIFDSSYTRSEPTVFPVNAVIPGWQMAITQMNIGERRRVVIPPDLAYGESGSPPVIPANATLTFDIILIGATDPNAARAEATQTAEDLLIQATAEAADFAAEPAILEPIMVDYVQDVAGYLAALPAGEVTCMTAYAGGIKRVEEIFSSRFQPPSGLIDQFDECMSDISTRNTAVGRIAIIGPGLSDDTVACIGEAIENPTLKPLFGIFDDAQVSGEWISAHFCLTPDERLAFEEALFANQPDRQSAGSGATFIDVQECMVAELGEARYFEPVVQPDADDREAMDTFFTNFTAFLIADIHCRQGEEGYELSDGVVMSEETAQCVADSLGSIRFGEVLLDRLWVPTVEEHVEVVKAYAGCEVQTDFLGLPESFGNLESSELSCLLSELSNHEDPRQTSLRAFAEMGERAEFKAGDLATVLFGADSCGIGIPGIPDGVDFSDTAVMCITGKIDAELYTQGRVAVLAGFDEALQDSADCFGDQ